MSKTKRYWYVIITYIVMQFSVFLFAPILYELAPITEFQAIVYWQIASFIMGLIVVLLLMRPDMSYERDAKTSDTAGIILWSIGGVFLALIAQAAASFIEMNVFGITPGSENTTQIMDIIRLAPLFIIIPTIVAPILEEIIFRKIIFGVLHKRMNFFFAATISALIFGLIHGEPIHILVYASMGYVFAFLYVKTKRIIVPIFTHMGMNTLVMFAQLSIDPEDIEDMRKQLEQMFIFIGQ